MIEAVSSSKTSTEGIFDTSIVLLKSSGFSVGQPRKNEKSSSLITIGKISTGRF